VNHVSKIKPAALVHVTSDQYRRSQPHSDRPPMRRYLLVVPFVFACAKGEKAPADSAAPAAATPAAPAAITDADISGTWTGLAKMEGTDSTIAHFSITCGSGTCRITTTESPKDTIPSTYVLAADSSTGTSSPYADASMPGAKLVDHWVARTSNNQVTGHGWLTLANKPDSVLMRYTFSGTKAP
jgi:hypothetical protein